MNPFLIVLIALWAYPILSLIFLFLTKRELLIRMWGLGFIFTLTALTVLALFTKVTTISVSLNWILISCIYLSASLILWWTQFQSNKFLKIIGILLMISTFGLGYLSSTLGILGVGLIVAEYETDAEKKLDHSLIYRERSLGNAISDYRGKRIEIYKIVTWLPVFEHRIIEKEYFDIITYSNGLKVNYDPNKHTIQLSTKVLSIKNNREEKWSDTIVLK